MSNVTARAAETTAEGQPKTMPRRKPFLAVRCEMEHVPKRVYKDINGEWLTNSSGEQIWAEIDFARLRWQDQQGNWHYNDEIEPDGFAGGDS